MKIQVQGLDEYALMLSKLGDRSRAVAGMATYAGAKVVADAIKDKLQSLPTVNDAYNRLAYKKYKSKLSATQKKGLISSFGISKITDDSGYRYVKVGFDGYNGIKTKKYPQGQPNILVARIVENGSSYMDATPFIKPAVNQSKAKAQEAMARVIEEEIQKIMK